MNLEFDTLDTPDVFWDYEETEPLYKETRLKGWRERSGSLYYASMSCCKGVNHSQHDAYAAPVNFLWQASLGHG